VPGMHFASSPSVAILCDSHAPLPASQCSAHSQEPRCLVSSLYLPVMAAREEAGRAW
jgi:hypothetical protein